MLVNPLAFILPFFLLFFPIWLLSALYLNYRLAKNGLMLTAIQI
ncbi:hypothetical protein HMPREF0476_0580 [Kingella kingae ATCC 23330]|uniref:Uncharacterized protein n=1 Tax=Kingella kingae ATCC 23330 TaxID=887327 RepID=F5S5U7_KINKI|nr:hypothetical protein HMPREF0476_0580 [Kingella kingae ATCC 23330]